MMHSQRNIKLW